METFNKKLKAILLLIGIVALTIPTFATIYEDAEDNATTGWISYGNTTNSSIENVEDMQRGSRVIKLTGNGKETGYRLGNRVGRASYVGAWHNKTEKILKWSMKYEEPFRIYIPITTEHGNRFLVYTNQSESKKGKIRGGKVRYGLGTDSTGGAWHTFKRDLEADWNAFMPSDPFVAVNGFFIKGSGYIDDIMSLDGNVSNWRICGGDTNGSTIENRFDLERGSIVTQLIGNGMATLFCYNLGNKVEKKLQWSMKYDEDFKIYVLILTEQGYRYLVYDNESTDKRGKIRGGKIYYGLGEDSIDGTWHTFTRDLEADLNAFEFNNSIISVNKFSIRGSGRVDDISLGSLFPF